MKEEARSEIVRQSIILVFSLAGVWAVYLMNDPDAWRTVKMGVALRVKHGAQYIADKAQEVAGKAANVYHQEQP